MTVRIDKPAERCFPDLVNVPQHHPMNTTSSAPPQIGVLYLDVIDHANFSEFEQSVRVEGLDVRIESRPQPGPYAGIEWLIPTAVIVYIGKAYFESILKEAGKDHYAILKAAIVTLSAKFTGKDAPKGRMIFSKGKAESETPRYSAIYSIVADLGDGFSAKLLLQTDFDAPTCNAAQEAFLTFLDDLYEGRLDPASVDGLAEAKPLGKTLLLAYDSNNRRLQVIDPLAGKR